MPGTLFLLNFATRRYFLTVPSFPRFLLSLNKAKVIESLCPSPGNKQSLVKSVFRRVIKDVNSIGGFWAKIGKKPEIESLQAELAEIKCVNGKVQEHSDIENEGIVVKEKE